MAKFKEAPAVIANTPDIYIVGLVKVGSDRYSVVTGTVANPIIDKASDPLNYAMEAVKAAAHKLGGFIP